MDARGDAEPTPARNRSTVERKSERELVVKRTINGPARLVQGSEMAFFGTYIEVTPHSRLVWTNDEGDDGGAVTTVTFEERDGKTLVVQHCTNLPRPSSRVHLVQGTNGLFQGYPNRVYIEDPVADKDGDRAAVFLDSDGSVTGTAGPVSDGVRNIAGQCRHEEAEGQGGGDDSLHAAESDTAARGRQAWFSGPGGCGRRCAARGSRR